MQFILKSVFFCDALIFSERGVKEKQKGKEVSFPRGEVASHRIALCVEIHASDCSYTKKYLLMLSY